MNAAVLTAGVLNAEQEEIKLSGLYLGAGVNVNEDKGSAYTRDSYELVGGGVIPDGFKMASSTDVSYGIHGVLGYSYLFPNRFFCAIEQEIGWTRHSAEAKAYFPQNTEGNAKLIKPFEFTTLARFGYGFETFPGVIYLSGGLKVLKIDYNDSKTLVRPAFGIGYQHAISAHWSMRGDILYTHISNVNFNAGKTRNGDDFRAKVKAHRLSGAISLIYTF